jgi:hypothetical protein
MRTRVTRLDVLGGDALTQAVSTTEALPTAAAAPTPRRGVGDVPTRLPVHVPAEDVSRWESEGGHLSGAPVAHVR